MHEVDQILIPRCGHSLMAESPDGVLHELKRFIGQHRTAPIT